MESLMLRTTENVTLNLLQLQLLPEMRPAIGHQNVLLGAEWTPPGDRLLSP